MAKRLLRGALVALFFPKCVGDKSLLGLPAGLLLANGIAQRIFRLNGKASYPVHFTSRVTNPRNLEIGNGVARYLAISGGCYIQSANGVEIGAGTMIAPGVKIVSANHGIDDRAEHVDDAPIKIGENCWLAANVVVLPGVSIGTGTVVGAGSVVSRDLPANCVAVGLPAKPLSPDGISVS